MNGSPGSDGGGGGGGGTILIHAGSTCEVAPGSLRAHGGNVLSGTGTFSNGIASTCVHAASAVFIVRPRCSYGPIVALPLQVVAVEADALP